MGFIKLEDKEVKPQKIGGRNMSSSSPVISTDSETTITGSLEELPKRIIVPLDGSDFSFRAAEYAINLAKLTGGEIFCVHALVDLPYIEYIGLGILTVTRYMNEAKNRQRNGFHK
jgi:hypothetical protein